MNIKVKRYNRIYETTYGKKAYCTGRKKMIQECINTSPKAISNGFMQVAVNEVDSK